MESIAVTAGPVRVKTCSEVRELNYPCIMPST